MATCSRFPARFRHAYTYALGPVLAGLFLIGGLLGSPPVQALALEDLVFAAYFTIGVEGSPQERIQRNTPQELAEYICQGQIESINLRRRLRGNPPYAIEYIGYFFHPEFGPDNLGLMQRQLYCKTRDAVSGLNLPDSTLPVDTVCRDQSQGSWLPFCKPVATCPVPPLMRVTDPEAVAHETGKYADLPDMSKLSEATITGAACIERAVNAAGGTATVTSGHRPPAYQTHLRDVWDKWQLLERNTDPACAALRKIVEKEKKRHRMKFQPGRTSRHSSGTAVDIAGVPEQRADAIAASCRMWRAVSGDVPHYEPR